MYLISLYFDDVINERIQSYMNQIAKRTGNEVMLADKVPPHITLSAFETTQESEAVAVAHTRPEHLLHLTCINAHTTRGLAAGQCGDAPPLPTPLTSPSAHHTADFSDESAPLRVSYVSRYLLPAASTLRKMASMSEKPQSDEPP